MRWPEPFLVALIVPALGGCVPMMAASAVGMVAEEAAGKPVSNRALQPQARAACSALAAKYGGVHIIDVEQNRIDRIIVWGTVTTASGRQSFECHYRTGITGFKLRPITVRGRRLPPTAPPV